MSYCNSEIDEQDLCYKCFLHPIDYPRSFMCRKCYKCYCSSSPYCEDCNDKGCFHCLEDDNDNDNNKKKEKKSPPSYDDFIASQYNYIAIPKPRSWQ